MAVDLNDLPIQRRQPHPKEAPDIWEYSTGLNLRASTCVSRSELERFGDGFEDYVRNSLRRKLHDKLYDDLVTRLREIERICWRIVPDQATHDDLQARFSAIWDGLAMKPKMKGPNGTQTTEITP